MLNYALFYLNNICQMWLYIIYVNISSTVYRSGSVHSTKYAMS